MKKVIELLKTGDFTILYHDNGYCAIYPGKIKYEQSDDTHKNYVKAVHDFDGRYDNGYAPDVVLAMAKALGGKVDSI